MTQASSPLPSPSVQMCTRTVMDGSDPDISFDADGICNYWHEYRDFAASLPSAEDRKARLDRLIADVRADGRGKPYDCVIGLSGGVDSSYVTWLAREWDLRPLIVHFDNGWNNELAVRNIENICKKLGFELNTFVMDWEEFRDLQRAYFKASVVDLEVPTDHMIMGALYRLAAKHKLKYILSGVNQATEWLMPPTWIYAKYDLVNLKNIHKKFGERPLKKLPALGVWQRAWYQLVRGVHSEPVLDLVDYDKAAAKELLIRELDWVDYGGKHYESLFTRFYQGYILPHKFGVDKRKAHLSNLILSGQMTREEALRELQQPTYDEVLQERDKAYVRKKLGFTESEFEAVLTLPNQRHEIYGTDRGQRDLYFRIVGTLGRALRAVGLKR
ncbi:MAG TPA: N-acetyl sugar amidotransferase [Sphingopyxis sp.]|nr:N-acetyl sugar amidotransferase [Sphingopyxis sp.]HMP44169.1 N-acetyl sugar amidotransferase [Sphingopyxis sp.]HMQ18343.1 N-acetyl sugar amidotransferase [Sphingopyxis sp.]